MDKKSLRREYLKLRADIPPEKRNAADSAIARKVEELPEFRKLPELMDAVCGKV